VIDPDAGDGPDNAWYRAELDACRRRIAELEEWLRTERTHVARLEDELRLMRDEARR
jgi:hypothetical protein